MCRFSGQTGTASEEVFMADHWKSSRSATSRALWKRSAGDLASSRSMTSASQLGRVRVQLADRPVRLVRQPLEDRQRRLGLERRLAGTQLVQQDAEAEQVGAGVQVLAARLLRGHVQRRAGHQAGPGQPHVLGGAGQPEVGQLHAVGPALQQDVGRLDVAVDQPLLVGGRQPRRHLRADADDVLQGQPARASRSSRASPSISCITR